MQLAGALIEAGADANSGGVMGKKVIKQFLEEDAHNTDRCADTLLLWELISTAEKTK